jgi:formiminotetrahydrofolate cyclodeaminase
MQHLTELIDTDASAFNAVMAAFKLPKTTEEEQTARNAAIQQGYKAAISIPLDTTKTTLECLKLLPVIIEKGNVNAISDAGTSALIAGAGIRGALLNVRLNLQSIKDGAYVKKITQEIHLLEREALILVDKVMQHIVSTLK